MTFVNFCDLQTSWTSFLAPLLVLGGGSLERVVLASWTSAWSWSWSGLSAVWPYVLDFLSSESAKVTLLFENRLQITGPWTSSLSSKVAEVGPDAMSCLNILFNLKSQINYLFKTRMNLDSILCQNSGEIISIRTYVISGKFVRFWSLLGHQKITAKS